MALEAGDMEEGQLSDSDSDMTVVPSDRPLQMAVSDEARRRRGWKRGRNERRGRAREFTESEAAGPRRTASRHPGSGEHPSLAAPTSPSFPAPAQPPRETDFILFYFIYCPDIDRGDGDMQLLVFALVDKELLACSGPGL